MCRISKIITFLESLRQAGWFDLFESDIQALLIFDPLITLWGNFDAPYLKLLNDARVASACFYVRTCRRVRNSKKIATIRDFHLPGSFLCLSTRLYVSSKDNDCHCNMNGTDNTTNAGFRLTCRLPHCRFDDDICSTAQAPLAAEGWPSGKQRQANRSITLPLCPPRQIADSWILFNLGAIAARWKAKAALPLRAATLKQQAMPSGVAAKRRAAS